MPEKINLEKQKQMIAKRRGDMPKIHRATYDKALGGKSLRAAVNSFCMECCYWQKEEVRLCTSPTCPLYPYRPYKISSNQGSEELSFVAESQKAAGGE